MDLRQWCLEFGISQEFDADDAVELIQAYESLYVPIHGRASTEQQLQPDAVAQVKPMLRMKSYMSKSKRK